MAHPFTLSKTNKNYVTVVVLFNVSVFLIFSELNGYEFGRITGQSVMYFLIPWLVAGLVWLVTGRREKGGRITFNVILTLLILGQLARVNEQLTQSRVLSELLEQQEIYKQAVLASNDAARVDSATAEFSNSVIDRLTELSKTTSGSTKHFYQLMCEFTTESQATAKNWRDAYYAVLSPDILDLSLLNSEVEFAHQKDVVEHYVDQTRRYRENSTNTVSNLEETLHVLGEENKLAAQALEGARDRHEKQMPILEPLLQAHLSYGNNMIRILELLQTNRNAWEYKPDGIVIHDDETAQQFDKLAEAISRDEDSLNRLSDQLLQGM